MILLAFIAVGQIVLEALGIDLASFRIAGALVLLVIACGWCWQRGKLPPTPTLPSAAMSRLSSWQCAFIAGPASIMAVVLLTDNNVYPVGQQAETAILLLLVLAFTYACLVGAEFVQRLLGPTGANVVSRIMGPILAALAVQSILTGRHDVLHW